MGCHRNGVEGEHTVYLALRRFRGHAYFRFTRSPIIELLNDPGTANSGKNVAITLHLHPLIQGLMRGSIHDKASSESFPLVFQQEVLPWHFWIRLCREI